MIKLPQWKEKTRSIRAQGAAVRRNYNPTTGSIHLKMYRYWQANSSDDRQQENFCHYWRCVMIWAPLYWAWPKLMVASAVCSIVLGGLGLVGAIHAAFIMATLVYVVLGAVAIGWFISNILDGIGHEDERKFSTLLAEGIKGERPSIRTFIYVESPAAIGIVIAVALVVAPIFGLVWMCRVIYKGIKKIFGHTSYFKASRAMVWRGLQMIGRGIEMIWRGIWRAIQEISAAAWVAFKWSFTTRPNDKVWLSWIRPILAVPAALAILATQYHWAVIGLWVVAGLALLGLLAVAMLWSADKYSQRALARKQAEQEREAVLEQARLDQKAARKQVAYEEFFRNLFDLKRPTLDSDITYEKWLRDYCKSIGITYDRSLFLEGYVSSSSLFGYSYGDRVKYNSVYGELDYWFSKPESVSSDTTPVSKPKKSSKTMAQVLEFLSFVWSVAVVNKWKICPLVEIPKD